MGPRTKATRISGRLTVALTLALALAGIAASSASAAFPYEFEPELSLRGNCTVDTADPIADPGCPYSPPPAGPSGRFADPRSITTDFYGNVYVASYAENAGESRIDVFDDEGFFVTELASGEGPRSLAVDGEGNLYAFKAASQEVLRYSPTVYEPEAGDIAYGDPPTLVGTTRSTAFGGLAIDRSNDRLYVAEGNRVRVYDSAAEGNGLLETIEEPKLGEWSSWAAVDAERGRLYVSYCKDTVFECGVLALEADAPHAVLAEVDGSETASGDFGSTKGWLSIAVDEGSGHFFVEDLEDNDNVYEYDESYELASTSPTKASPAATPCRSASPTPRLTPKLETPATSTCRGSTPSAAPSPSPRRK